MVYSSGVSDSIISLCTSGTTVASALAKNPKEACHKVWLEQYPKPFVLKRLVNRFFIKHDLYYGRGDPTQEDLDRAAKCGKFPYRPSDLFLKMFSDVLLCLERDPMAGVCPPPLLGTSAVMPLSVISVIPDIMQHYYDCIVLAEKEVILATNYWQPSNSVDKISAALIELSKRAGARGQKNLIVKIMWDRGTLSQLYENHAHVNQEGREELKLPKLAEIPNLHLEVINFHRPVMGTFHAKYLIIDRKVALINSNNIQDRPNLEMMVHLEGAVVESFYDIFLYSWHHSLRPVLPCLMEPPPMAGKQSSDFKFMEMNPYLANIELAKAARAARAMLTKEHGDDAKLGALRHQAAKDAGFNPQARLQGFLGALTESRRGSFSGENDAGMLNGDASGTAKPKGGQSIRFTDVVSQAMDRRRKSFNAPRPQNIESQIDLPPIKTNGLAEPAPTADSHSPKERQAFVDQVEEKLSSPERSKQHYREALSEAEGASAVNHSAQAQDNNDSQFVLPPLNLSNGSRPNVGISQQPSEGLSPSSGDALHPITNGDRSLSPIYSERNVTGTSAFVNGDAHSNSTNLSASTSTAPFPPQAEGSSSILTSGNGTSANNESSHTAMHPVRPPVNGIADSASSVPSTYRQGPQLNGVSSGAGSSPKKRDSMGGSSIGKKRGLKSGLSIGTARSRSASLKSSTGPPESHTPRQQALSSHLNAGALSEAWSKVEDTDSLDEFNPHTLHKPHDPFPIAMVNRKPHGLPGHQDIRVPQDAAWLAAFRYAQKSVFIQTPTFNAKPIIRAALEACRRGIQVTIYVDLGFNDKGESMPFQGGTNEEVVERMYKDLNTTRHQKNLHVFWYVGKDQVRPLNAVKKQRNCHVKFMQVDDQVGIQGNGNQDTQSWYHSCEINIMVDSAQIVADWMAAIHRQQNTALYGRVDDDGIWRDKVSGRTPAQMEEYENEQARIAEEQALASEQGSSASLPRKGSRSNLIKRRSGSGTPLVNNEDAPKLSEHEKAATAP